MRRLLHELDPLRQTGDESLHIDDYVLKYGAFEYFAPQRAMLLALTDRNETVGTFTERLGEDAYPFELIETYIGGGAFTHPVLYPALARLRRSRGEEHSLVRRALEPARELIERDEVLNAYRVHADDDTREIARKTFQGLNVLIEAFISFADDQRIDDSRIKRLWGLTGATRRSPTTTEYVELFRRFMPDR